MLMAFIEAGILIWIGFAGSGLHAPLKVSAMAKVWRRRDEIQLNSGLNLPPRDPPAEVVRPNCQETEG